LGISFCLFCFRRYFTKFTQLFNTERYIPSAWADFDKIEFLSMLQLFTALTLKIVAFWLVARCEKFGKVGKATIHRLNFENSCLLADGAERETFGMAERQLFADEAPIIVAFWPVDEVG
jgi:hypothetical protein